MYHATDHSAFNIQSIRGLTVEEAVAKLRAAGLSYRITRQDGEEHGLARGIRNDRVNFEVENGRVSSVRSIG